jgi:hypothetical protein
MYETAGYKCRVCREECPERVDALPGEKFLTLDHIIPKSKGGPSAEWNLRVLCNVCNEAKGDKWSLEDFGRNPPWEYYSWAAVQQQREQERARVADIQVVVDEVVAQCLARGGCYKHRPA